jgi:hypothetical protein
VIDLGLRLEDVRANDLASEDVSYGRSDPTENLRRNGATADEIAYLCSDDATDTYVGKRVELNAFTSGDLIRWVEGKLEAQGVQKVVPDREVLLQAYQRAYEQHLLRRRVRQLRQEVHEVAKGVELPADLAAWVQGRVEANRTLPWDRAVKTYACRRIEQKQKLNRPNESPHFLQVGPGRSVFCASRSGECAGRSQIHSPHSLHSPQHEPDPGAGECGECGECVWPPSRAPGRGRWPRRGSGAPSQKIRSNG